MMKNTLPVEKIERSIYLIRGQKVILDIDLAILYQVETKVLIQSVKRNLERFPDDFMFQLDGEEFINLKSQIVTSSSGWGGRRRPPYAFTEQGIAMLSGVLRSKRATYVNIEIMRSFVRLREILKKHENLFNMFNQLEDKYDEQFRVVFETLAILMDGSSSSGKAKKKIGFNAEEEPGVYNTKGNR